MDVEVEVEVEVEEVVVVVGRGGGGRGGGICSKPRAAARRSGRAARMHACMHAHAACRLLPGTSLAQP